MANIPPNRVRIQSGGKTTVGTVVGVFAGGHAHSGPSESVRVVAVDGGEPLGLFCRWCRTRVGDGPPATMLVDTVAVIEGHMDTYAN